VASYDSRCFKKPVRDGLSNLTADSRGVQPGYYTLSDRIGYTIVRVAKGTGGECQTTKTHQIEFGEDQSDNSVPVAKMMVERNGHPVAKA
jgi:hypothetical protein